MTVRDEVRGLIARELALNGIHLDETAWLASEAVLDELAHVLTPERHEGRTSPIGVIFADSAESLGKLRKLPLDARQIELGRRLADGAHSFLLYERAKFSGLVFLPEPRATELELVRMVPSSGGMIVQRSADGVTKFFRQSGITAHFNRNWFAKPHVREASRRISQCVAGINRSVLNRILEFAFHLLSPASRIGAMLVWNLVPDALPGARPRVRPGVRDEQTGLAGGSNIQDLHLSLLDERDSAAICHLLSQVDGATILGSEGELLQTGIHLKSSTRAAGLIPEFKGTRHTSGQRFSYDHPETLVIAISEDGPVTIFCDGASIADLRAQSAEQEAKLLRSIAPEKKEQISSRALEAVCRKCGKTAMVEEISVAGCKEHQTVRCPVCASPLYTSECFALKCSPYKALRSLSPPRSHTHALSDTASCD